MDASQVCMSAGRSSPRGAIVPTQKHVKITMIPKCTNMQKESLVNRFTHHINDYKDSCHGVTSEKDP